MLAFETSPRPGNGHPQMAASTRSTPAPLGPSVTPLSHKRNKRPGCALHAHRPRPDPAAGSRAQLPPVALRLMGVTGRPAEFSQCPCGPVETGPLLKHGVGYLKSRAHNR